MGKNSKILDCVGGGETGSGLDHLSSFILANH